MKVLNQQEVKKVSGGMIWEGRRQSKNVYVYRPKGK